MEKKVKVIEVQGLPHTLTQTDGNTFRLFARQEKVIEEKLVSKSFYSEQDKGNLLIVPVEEKTEKVVKSEETKNSKGGQK